MNGTGTVFDVDYIVWESSLPDNPKIQTFTSQDAGFEYLRPQLVVIAKNPRAMMVFNFTQTRDLLHSGYTLLGSLWALYGCIDEDYGNFSCTIKGVGRGTNSRVYATSQDLSTTTQPTCPSLRMTAGSASTVLRFVVVVVMCMHFSSIFPNLPTLTISRLGI